MKGVGGLKLLACAVETRLGAIVARTVGCRPGREHIVQVTYSMGATDTDDHAAGAQISLLRRMPALRKAKCIRDLTRTVHILATAGVRMRHPRSTEREVSYRLAVLRLGEDIAARVYAHLR